MINSNKHIVVVEISETGYISKVFDDYTKASLLYKILIATFANYFYKDSRSSLPKFLKENNFKEYRINGNIKILSKAIESKTDGKDSVHIFEVKEDFCLESFIKERENNSTIFLHETASQLELEKLKTLFGSNIILGN